MAHWNCWLCFKPFWIDDREWRCLYGRLWSALIQCEFVLDIACFSICSCFLSEVSADAQHHHTKKAMSNRANEFSDADLTNFQCCHSDTKLEACSVTWNRRTAFSLILFFFFVHCSESLCLSRNVWCRIPVEQLKLAVFLQKWRTVFPLEHFWIAFFQNVFLWESSWSAEMKFYIRNEDPSHSNVFLKSLLIFTPAFSEFLSLLMDEVN